MCWFLCFPGSSLPACAQENQPVKETHKTKESENIRKARTVRNNQQDEEQEEQIKSIIATLADDLPEGEQLADYSDKLLFLSRHPLNLNTATTQQLKQLFFLSPLNINNLLIHIEQKGKLIDVLELQSIPDFDSATIAKLLPFITLKLDPAYRHVSPALMLQKGNNELLGRYAQTLEKQKGYTNLPGSRYLGTPQKLLLKYRYTFGDLLSAAILLKKDAGEAFFSGSNKSGFDFISGSLALKKTGRINKLIIGDYSLQFGQGLTLWSGFSFGKGADVAGVAKKDIGLSPYTSGSEYSFFRGIATNVKLFKNIALTSYISLRHLDSGLSADTLNQLSVSGINTSGLHRTASEIGNQGTLRQLFYGSALQYDNSKLNLGIVVARSLYSHPFVTGNKLYNFYNFSGTNLTNIGIQYSYTIRNIYLFGETAKSLPGGFATLNGIMTSLAARVSAVVLYHNYAKNHINFYSQGLAEGSDTKNEKGIYAGINISPARHWTISSYLHTFQFPWLKYRIDASATGDELMGQLTYQPSKAFNALLRFKTKASPQNTNQVLPFNSIEQVKNENYRLELNWKLSKKISCQSRAEMSRYRKTPGATTSGYLIYQDIDYSSASAPISGNIRLAGFATPDYNSRIYAYEDDLLYASGSGLYYGKGMRTYLNVKYRITRQLQFWLKYSLSIYAGQEKTGTALDEIDGNKKSELKAQLRYQF